MSKTHTAGQKQPKELGLFDMSGNVWECCNDWFDATYHRGSEEQNPPGPAKGEYRELRGGSWFHNAQNCRVSDRSFGSVALTVSGLLKIQLHPFSKDNG